MQRIVKGQEPQALTDWRQGQIDADIPPRYRDLQNPQKGACRTQLLQEQGGICCYCNKLITPSDMHIEHLVPQSVDESLGLDWTNVLGCCAPQNAKGRKLRTQCHCGEFRGDADLGVTPLQEGCEAQFGYTFGGEIVPAPPTNAQAEKTISNLNLEAERLRNARGAVLAEAYLALESLSAPEWLAVYVERDANGYPEFAGMLRWFWETSWGEEMELLTQ